MAEIHKGYTYPWEVVAVIPDFPATIIVQFADWTVRTVDLTHLTERDNPGVFANLRVREYFNQVRALDGMVTWPGELDLDPETMYARSH